MIALFFSALSLTFSLNSKFLNTLVKTLMFIPKLTMSLFVVLKGIFIPFSLLLIWIGVPLILLFFIKVYIGDSLTEELILFLSLTIGSITLVSFGDKWITKYLSYFSTSTSRTLGLFQEYEIAKIIFKKYLHQNRLKLYIFVFYFFLIIASASIELGNLECVIYGSLIDLDLIIYSLAAFIAFDRIISSKHLLEKPDEVKSLSS